MSVSFRFRHRSLVKKQTTRRLGAARCLRCRDVKLVSSLCVIQLDGIGSRLWFGPFEFDAALLPDIGLFDGVHVPAQARELGGVCLVATGNEECCGPEQDNCHSGHDGIVGGGFVLDAGSDGRA
jgi:hypothetical protein